MARLNLDPTTGAKQHTSPPAPSSSPDSTVITCLGVIPQNDLNRISDRTDIAEFIEQGDGNLENALKAAHAIVQSRHKLNQDVTLHCAFDIRTVWHKVADYASRTPAAAATITQWQHDIRHDIDIDHYLSMAESTLHKYSQYMDRIERAWGIPINIALPQGLIPPIGWLSKSLMQKMAQLAECTLREEAATLLKDNIGKRTGYNTRTARSRTSSYLMLSDVSAALKQSESKMLKAPKSAKRAHAGLMGTARKKRKPTPAPNETLASDPATSNAGPEPEHSNEDQATEPMSEDIVEAEMREQQNPIDDEQGEGMGRDSRRDEKQRQGDGGQEASSTTCEKKDVDGDQAAGYDELESDEMSIEQGRGVDLLNLDDFDTTRSSWSPDMSASPTSTPGQPLRSSDLPKSPYPGVADTSLSTPNALVPFRIEGPSIRIYQDSFNEHSRLISQSHLASLQASLSVTAATHELEPLSEWETTINASCLDPEQQASSNTTKDQLSVTQDVREGDPLEASKPSHRRGNPSPMAQSLSDTSVNTVDMVNNAAKATVAKAVTKSHATGNPFLRSQKSVECTAEAAIVGDRAQAPSHLSEQESPHGSGMIVSQIRQTSLSTMHPGEQLSSTAIQDVLACVRPPDCHIFDPLFFNDQSLSRLSDRFQIEDTITKVLLPIRDPQRKHWYLAVLAISDSTIRIYDSLICKRQSLSQSTQLQRFARRVRPQQQAWTVQLAECPQQCNSYDCGIYTIVTAFYVMARISLPATYDNATWRLLCRCLLREAVNEDQLSSLIGIAEDSSTIDSALYNTQINNQDNWIINTLQQAVLVAEKYLKTLRMKQASLQSLQDSAHSSLHTLRVLHNLIQNEIDDLAIRITEDQDRLRLHSNILKQYSTITTDKPETQQPVIQTALSSIRSAQTYLETQLWRVEKKAKNFENNVERISDAIATGQRVEKIYEASIQQAESRRRESRQRMESWREHFDSKSRQIAQLLAKDMNS